MLHKRPLFLIMWNNFIYIYGDGGVSGVGEKIGGKVGENIELGKKDPKMGFTNACAIRMSYCLNHSGVHVIGNHTWKTVSGADSKLYIYRLRDLRDFLKHSFGKPDKVIKNPKPADFAGLKGILIFNVQGWNDASGHATLWDGNTCSDHCFFPVASEASLWQLK